ncbi:acetyltransferase [Nocardioides sp. JQ2195]|uniref:GNAT family N-acetyltransferase n=1 Tax=Nocardioides sp. JQ2195 TaxID=2592334 RepID=UPI00143E5F50|nr:GNAT family N-acetyltransferase [Nocardioides sp. JQ2195]QIX26988.1 acetyltransferase [Nocardioides sp. JQ2195]
MAEQVHVVVRHGERELSGVVHGDESWNAAAQRLAATVMGEPTAVDLSAEPKRFIVDPDLRVLLRPMERGDLPDVARWRAAEHVHKWWFDDGSPDLETVTAKYAPHIDGTTPTRMWVVEVNGRSVGFLQDYRLSDYPEFALLTPDPEAIGVDYAIGEDAWIGKGLGAAMLWAWLRRTRKRFPDATTYFAAPDHRNAASLRVLEKVGFVQGTWFDEPLSDGTTATVVGCALDVRRVLG